MGGKQSRIDKFYSNYEQRFERLEGDVKKYKVCAWTPARHAAKHMCYMHGWQWINEAAVQKTPHAVSRYIQPAHVYCR